MAARVHGVAASGRVAQHPVTDADAWRQRAVHEGELLVREDLVRVRVRVRIRVRVRVRVMVRVRVRVRVRARVRVMVRVRVRV